MIPAPDYIQFYPTMRCNLSCDFCFNKSMPSCDDITFRNFKNIADKLANLNIRAIDIMGGEPTLHKDIIPIIEYASEKKFQINLSSNGLNSEILSEIIINFKRVNVGLSINNRENLKRLKKFIEDYRPMAKMVFSDDIDMRLLNLLSLLTPNKFYLLYQDIMRKEQIEKAVPFPSFLIAVQGLIKTTSIVMVYCSGFIPETVKYPVLSKKRCPAGTTKLGLMPDGSVYPCNLFFGTKEFKLGNLLYDSFESIWNHRKLEFFRTFNDNACPKTSCILHQSCHGGCPAHSLIHYGDLGSPEPRCNSNNIDKKHKFS